MASRAADPGTRINDDWRESRRIENQWRITGSEKPQDMEIGETHGMAAWKRCDMKAVGSLSCSVL